MVSAICSAVAMALWIGAVAGFIGTTEYAVDVVEVYSSLLIARARLPWSLPPSGMKTDAALLLSLVRDFRMIWKVGSVVPWEIGAKVVNWKFKMISLETFVVETTNMQLLVAGTFSGVF